MVIQVVNGSDLTPIEGAVVDFSSCGEGIFTSDNTGVVRVNARQGINCQCEIRKYGYISSNLNITTTGLSPSRNMEVILTRIGEDYLGTVVNLLSGYQLDNVNVRAINQASGSSMEAYTNSRGEYSMALRPNTSYIIRYSKGGFVDVNRTIKTGDGLDRSIMGTISLTPSGAIQTNDDYRPVAKGGVSDIPESYGEDAEIPYPTEQYSIQVAAIPVNRNIDLDNYERKLGEISTVYFKTEGTNNKIRVGPFMTREEAKSVLPVVKSKGYSSAYIVKEEVKAPAAPVLQPKGGSLQPRDIPREFDEPMPIPAPVSQNAYWVQLAAYSNTNYFDPSKVSDLGAIESRPRGGLTIYYLGDFATQTDANKALATARKRGFSGAYVVKKSNDKFGRVSN